MKGPPPATDPPPPPERRFEPRRREAEEVIHWLRILGGRYQPKIATRRVSSEVVRGRASANPRGDQGHA